ncbi:MAG: hypothetical protein WCF13_08130, partial [Stellaceae bacterium]
MNDDDTHGPAVLLASDRMLTAGDIEYEPPKLKMGQLTANAIALVAGEIVVHSEALAEVQRQLALTTRSDVSELADLYASQIRAIKNKRAEHLFLSPLGLDLKSFVAVQRSMDEGQLAKLTRQLQDYTTDTHAIIAGCDNRGAHIYLVDEYG